MRSIPLAVFLGCVAAAAGATPDLTGMVPILEERFADGLNRFDGRRGVWSTLPRRGQVMTNAAETVFLDDFVLGPEVPLPPVHAITDQGLALRTVALPDAVLPALGTYMQATGQGAAAADIRYATGMISTAQTWAQTYGYVEIEARIPRGQGRWPAFWLSFAGPGWPPEIDVMEAYGAGFLLPTKRDNRLITGVLFDALDADLAPTQAVDIENPFALPGERQARVKLRGKVEVHTFARTHDAALLGADIYGQFNTYAALWTPETISFLFGPDRAHLSEIFRAPTPEDARAPMYLIANDQFTARGGGWPARAMELPQVLDPDNAFLIRRITVMAPVPATTLRMAAGENPHDSRDSTILDTPGNDEIGPGAGFDLITLTSGADRLLLSRGRDNKIVAGFGADDVLVLDGYPFVDAADALARLTQVGADVWLPSGADPFWPQTLIFRDTEVAAFSEAQVVLRWPVGRDVWASDAARQTRADVDLDGDGLMGSALPGAWLNDRGDRVTMTGTSGPDRFLVANADTEIREAPGGDVDTLIAFVSLTLPPNIERGIARAADITLQGGAGDDRLEAEGARITLEGGAGDDLYVLAPGAETAVIRIGAGDGNDQLRGMAPGHRLELARELTAGRAGWTLTAAPGGTRIGFGPGQSLLIEGYSLAEARRVLE
jgi:Ca2+-binding RTX toxin-like protein